MALVKYQIVSSAVGTAAGQSTILPVRAGKIVLVVFRGWIQAAAASGAWTVELGYNQSTQVFAEAQNPQRQVSVASAAYGHPTINTYQGIFPTIIPSDWKIAVGDQLCINIQLTGTAPSSARHIVDIYVEE